MGPNVVLIVLDTARADAFEPYGAPGGSSPAIAQLASDGFAVDHAFAPANWTVPSHASMLTGLLPRAMGLAQAPGGTAAGVRKVMQSHADVLLPTVLRERGWETRGISANLWISAQSGFDTGFERFDYVHGDRHGIAPAEHWRSRLTWDISAIRATADAGAAAAEEAIDGWLGGRRDRPFFLFVNLIECHSPYLPPKPYNDLGLLERLRAAEASRRYLTLEGMWRASLGALDVPADVVERMRHLYAQAIRLMDDWIARLRQTLSSRGLAEDTVVMVVSDHGEHFNEHGMMGHCFSLHDTLIRVPVVAAGADAAYDGALMSLTDIPRVIGEWAGIGDAPWDEYPLAGDAVVAEMDALGPPDHPKVLDAIEQWGLDAEGVRRLTANVTCATDGRFKLLRAGDADVLYDLGHDPGETTPTDASTPAHLRRALDVATGLEASAPVPPADDVYDEGYTEEEAAVVADQLRQLGYL